MSPIILAILGLVLFMLGQYLESRRTKKRMDDIINKSARLLETYHGTIKKVLTARGIDPKEIEREIIAVQLREAINTVVKHTMPELKGDAEIEIKELTEEEFKKIHNDNNKKGTTG